MATAPGKKKVRAAKEALYRDLVLEAAEEVFAQKGYDDSKMDEIAHESGLSVQTVYSVFAGKADIFRAIHEAGDRDLLDRAVAAARGLDDPLAALRRGVRLEGKTLQFGLTDDEIEDVWERIEDLIEDVDDGEIPVF